MNIYITGPIPEPGNACPGLLPDGTLTSLPLPHTGTATREVNDCTVGACVCGFVVFGGVGVLLMGWRV